MNPTKTAQVLDLRGSVFRIIREKGTATAAAIQIALNLHKIPILIAIAALQNENKIEHGYITPDGDWLEDYHYDDHNVFLLEAYRLTK